MSALLIDLMLLTLESRLKVIEKQLNYLEKCTQRECAIHRNMGEIEKAEIELQIQNIKNIKL